MIRFLTCTLFFLAICGAVNAQQPPASTPWNVTMQTNTVADSTLTVVNRCQKNHQFQIQTQNVPFLQVSSNQANVKGGQSQVIPVKFDTRNLAPGVYQGQVLVICLSCKSEGTCTQDREVLQVTLRVTGDSPAAGPPGAPTTNQPANTPTTNQPATTQSSPPVVADEISGKQVGVSGTPIVGTQISPLSDRCAALEAETERLRQIAEEKKAAAEAAQREADKQKEAADQAEKDAKAAEDAAKKKAEAAQPDPEGGRITADGETFSGADSAWLEAKKKKLLDDRLAGRITPEEHERLREELSGTEALKKAREERLANEARLKKEAEEARAAADKARADADKAKAKADEAQRAADQAKKEADEAQKEFDESARKLEEACREEREARAAADKKQKDDEAKAAAAAAEEKKRKEEEGRPRIPAIDDPKYLLDNINELGLITYKLKIDIPKPLDFVFNNLRKLADAQVVEFIQTVADQLGGGPIPGDLPTALTELANSIGSFFDPRTAGGMTRAFEKLTGLDGGPGMINPRTGRKYTDVEASVKIEQMTKLMIKLRDKLKQAQAQAGTAK